MKKVLTSIEKLSPEIKKIVHEKFPKEELPKHLVKISKTDTHNILGVLFQHEGTEYLIKMIYTPIENSVNLDAIINDLDMDEKPNE